MFINKISEGFCEIPATFLPDATYDMTDILAFSEIKRLFLVPWGETPRNLNLVAKTFKIRSEKLRNWNRGLDF